MMVLPRSRLPAATLLMTLCCLSLSACMTTTDSGGDDYEPPVNPTPRDMRVYQLKIDPPLPPEDVRVEVVYRATGARCPVSQVGEQSRPRRNGQGLSIEVALDRFQDDGCGWEPGQLWIALRADDDFNTRFSLPLATSRQVRWCRLNAEHGACMASERDIRGYKIPGQIHRVVVYPGT